MSAFNGRFEPATILGKSLYGVVGVVVGIIMALAAVLFLAFPMITVVCLFISIIAFTIGGVALRIGDEAIFFPVMVRHWWYRKLTTLDQRDL
jgi:hypothetical protein